MIKKTEEIEKAIELLEGNGYRVSKYGKEGLFIVKCPPKSGPTRYSIRQRKNSGHTKKWPKGTVIAKVNESKLKWEPIKEDK